MTPDDETEWLTGERDNYRRALAAALAGTSEHNVPRLDRHTMLITRTAVAIMREVLRGGTLSNTGILSSAGAYPPERDADPPPHEALLAVAEAAQEYKAACIYVDNTRKHAARTALWAALAELEGYKL